MIPFWDVPIVDPADSTSIIPLISSIIPPPVIITQTQAGGTEVPRTVHPPPSPYQTPSPTGQQSTEGQPPGSLTWTSHPSTATACTSPRCGKRCVGLFCDFPCLLDCPKSPDPDWWDPTDPDDPWQSKPWEPEDEDCTTTTASSCGYECVASGTSTKCDSTCSLTYGCSATDAESTLGTYTLAPYGSFYYESWNTAADDNAAYTSSVFSSVHSVLDSYFPDLYPKTTKTSAAPAPQPTLGVGDACTTKDQCSHACGSGAVGTSAQPGCYLGKCVCDRFAPPADTFCRNVDQCNAGYACASTQTMECKANSNGDDVCTCVADSSHNLLATAQFFSHVWPMATTNETISGQPGWVDSALGTNSSSPAWRNSTVGVRLVS